MAFERTSAALRADAEFIGAWNPLEEQRLLRRADELEARPHADRAGRLNRLEAALFIAQLEASRAAEADVHEAVSELLATVVERRRLATRVLPRG